MEHRFIVDNNAGKLVKWLRMMGYDTLFFNEQDDGRMVKTALAEDRVVVTRDTQIIKRRVATTGEIKVILLNDENPERQLNQVVKKLRLEYKYKPFSLCLECNQHLKPREKDEVRDLVPAYVFNTQNSYMQCPACRRVYWKGTHWDAMNSLLQRLEQNEE